MATLVNVYKITKKFGNITALNNINIDLGRGKIIGLLGPNGSGKTTLIKLCSGLLTPNIGQITINGRLVGVESKKVVSYLPDRNFIPDDMKVTEIIRFFKDFYMNFDERKAYEMMTRLGIDFNSKFKTMSKGTKEKVQLCLVMSRNADLYLLDEPIAGVDPAVREYILNTIVSNFNRNTTVIISTHLITDIEPVLDEVIMIKNGNLLLHKTVEQIKLESGMTVDAYFREVYRC